MEGKKGITKVFSEAEIDTVARLADTIWREHYTSIIGKGQVDYMLDKYQSVRAITNQIKENAHYYLVWEGNMPAGYFSYYKKPSELFLSKIYILKDLRGHGLGKLAMEFIEMKATEEKLPAITLTVNRNNSRSIAAYEKMGFYQKDAVVMDIGGGYVMDDYVMEKQL